MMKKKEKDMIETKKYFYAVLIIVGSILLTIYIFSLYQAKKEERLMNSYLISSNTVDFSVDNLDSLIQILEEAPASYFIYLSYTNDENVYNFEKSLKTIIDKYKLNDIFYYVNLTKMKDENPDYLKEIKTKLKIDNLNRLPVLIYVNDGKIIDSNIIDGINNQIITTSEVEKLLEIYEFEIVK